MKVVYDPDTDTLSFLFRNEPVAESDELREGLIIDYGRDGKIVSFEVLDASQHVIEPQMLEDLEDLRLLAERRDEATSSLKEVEERLKAHGLL
jgi:uncharacterized protein YuzE